MTSVRADPLAVDDFLARRARGAAVVALCALPPAIGVLVVDYRLMIFSIVLAVLPLIPAIEVVRLRRTVGAGGAIAVRCDAAALHVTVERTKGPSAAVALACRDVFARVAPDAVVIASLDAVARRWRMWTVPAREDDAREMGRELERAGARVRYERRPLAMLVLFLGGVIVQKALGVVAAACALGALANLVLAVAHHGGSYALACALFAGAFAAKFGVALMQRALAAAAR